MAVMSSSDPGPRACLADELSRLRARVGDPSYRKMAKLLAERRATNAVGETTLRNAATAEESAPKLTTVIQFVSACRWIAEGEGLEVAAGEFDPELWRTRWLKLGAPETPEAQDLVEEWKAETGTEIGPGVVASSWADRLPTTGSRRRVPRSAEDFTVLLGYLLDRAGKSANIDWTRQLESENRAQSTVGDVSVKKPGEQPPTSWATTASMPSQQPGLAHRKVRKYLAMVLAAAMMASLGLGVIRLYRSSAKPDSATSTSSSMSLSPRSRPSIELGARQRGAEHRSYVTDLDVKGYGTVDVRAVYTATEAASNVAIYLSLPDQLSIDKSEFGILNANNPGAAVLSKDTVTESWQGLRVTIGHYSAGSNALVIFPVNLARPQELPCGSSVFMLRAEATAENVRYPHSSIVRLNYHRTGSDC
jgi:hypothetical protein